MQTFFFFWIQHVNNKFMKAIDHSDLSGKQQLKKKHVKQIKGVHRRATHFIKNRYTRQPETVTKFLNKLNWILLKEQRIISQLTLFHKAIHDDSGLAFPDYVVEPRRHL